MININNVIIFKYVILIYIKNKIFQTRTVTSPSIRSTRNEIKLLHA